MKYIDVDRWTIIIIIIIIIIIVKGILKEKGVGE
jgi:hypothetical protein